MQLNKQVEHLFRPLISEKAWGAKIGLGSFVTIEFGPKHLYSGHYHGEWHLWLYLCEWELHSDNHLLASESKKRLMQLAVENLNGRQLTAVSLNAREMVTQFTFDTGLHLRCKPYADSVSTDEIWMLFTPDGQVGSLLKSDLKLERSDSVTARTLVPR